jgi:hypothetical protein
MSAAPVLDRAADLGTAVALVATGTGFAIGDALPYLQAGAFLVAMFAGVCAGGYHLYMTYRKWKDK